MKLTFFLAFFSLGLALMAQESAVVLSDKIAGNGFSELLVKDEQGYVILKENGYRYNKFTLLRYNSLFVLEWKLKINNKIGNVKVETVNVFYINDKIIVLQIYRNKKNKEVTLYMKEINRFGRELSERIVAKRHTKDGYSPFLVRRVWNYILVKDQQESTDTINRSEYSLLNVGGEVLWNKTMVFPHPKGLFQYWIEHIDSQGNLFIFAA
jgi:hypothetical protein